MTNQHVAGVAATTEPTRDQSPADRTADEQAALSARFHDLALGYQHSQLLYVAAKLGLADLLAEAPQTVEELAAATQMHAPSLARVLRALAGFGVFAERDDGRYELTPLARPLRSGVPGSLRALVLVQGEDLYPVWGQLLYSVQTGKPAFDQVHGMPNWAYRERHPEVNARFNAGLAANARASKGSVAAVYPFPERGLVVDVGGADGTLLTLILAPRPGLRGVLFDQPHVAAAAGPTLTAAGVTDRVEIVGGDFFTAVPAGGDYYVLSAILHDWDDDRATAILAQCRQAMAPAATLLLVERVLPAGNDPSPVKMMDINMLVTNAGGRERTEADWRALLAAGGFALQRRVVAGSTYEVIEAVPC
jgi:hypothetical protein